MGVLQRFERRLEGMVGLAFARIFKGKVHPAEIAKALQREADEQRSVLGEGRVLAPNVYVVTPRPRPTSSTSASGPTSWPTSSPTWSPSTSTTRATRSSTRSTVRLERDADLPHRRLRGQLARRRPRAARRPRGRRGRRAARSTATRRCPAAAPAAARPHRHRHRQAGPLRRRPRRLAPGVTHVLVVDGPGTRHELTTGRNVHRPRHRGRHPAARHRRQPQARRRRPRRRHRDGRGPRLHQRHAGQRPPGQPPGARRRRRHPDRPLGAGLPAGRPVTAAAAARGGAA